MRGEVVSRRFLGHTFSADEHWAKICLGSDEMTRGNVFEHTQSDRRARGEVTWSGSQADCSANKQNLTANSRNQLP